MGGSFYYCYHDKGETKYELCKCGGKILVEIGIKEKDFDDYMCLAYCGVCDFKTGSCWDSTQALELFRAMQKKGE